MFSSFPRLAAALAAAAISICAMSWLAFPASANEAIVTGTVLETIGAQSAPNGAVRAAGSVDFSVTRTRRHGKEIVTIVPR